MIKNVFYLTLKAKELLRYLNFCPNFFDHVEKWLDEKAKVKFKTCNVINWETNNNSTYMAQYLKK